MCDRSVFYVVFLTKKHQIIEYHWGWLPMALYYLVPCQLSVLGFSCEVEPYVVCGEHKEKPMSTSSVGLK